MRYRLATEDDATQLAELRWQWRVEEEDRRSTEAKVAFVNRFASFAREGLAVGRWTAWIAEDGDVIVANIWIYRVPKVPTPGKTQRDFGYVTNVYTQPSARNRGIGTELLGQVGSWAAAIDLEMLIVWPSDRSLPWYGRGGFALSEEMHEREVSGYEG